MKGFGKLIPVLSILFLTMFILSCGQDELTLDCTNSETFSDSTAKMVEHLSKEGTIQELQGFNIGIVKISMEYTMSRGDEKILKKFDGWTISRVIEYGK